MSGNFHKPDFPEPFVLSKALSKLLVLLYLSIYLSIYLLISKSRPNNPSLSGTACKLISLGEYRRGTLGCIWGHFGVNLGLLWVYVDGFW